MDAPLPSPEATGTPQGQPSAFDSVGIGLLEADPGTGRLLKVNRAYCEITGYGADELLAMTAGDLNHEDDAAWDARAYGRLARGESHYDVDKRYVRKDGRVVWVHVVGDVIRDDAGRVVRVYAAVSDITARVRTEQTLRDLAQRQAYLLALDAALQPLQDEADVQHTATRLLGQYLHAERVLYVDVEAEDTFAIRATFGRGAPLAGRWPIPPFGGDLVASLMRGEALVIDDTATDARLDEAARAPFRHLGIGATMGVALLDGARWVGAFGAHESHARAWTPWEVTAMRETAARTWAAVQRARTGMRLRDSEARYRLLFEHSTTGVVVTDADGQIVQCNPAFAALVGRTLTDLEGAPISAVVHPDDRDAHRRRGELFWNGADPACDWEHRCLRPNGSEVWVRCVCHRERDETGRMARLARFVTDITERRQAEGALRESQEQRHDLVETLHLLLETAAQGILSIDVDGRIASANRAVEDMFGYGRDGLLGESVERLLPEALRGAHARHRASFWRAPEPRPMGRGRDLVGMRADGTTFPVEVTLNYVMTNGGGRAVAFITDISERKAAEST
ncbi:MAG: PAS domain S-box protein, partial [Vicinamibacterales bacterium]